MIPNDKKELVVSVLDKLSISYFTLSDTNNTLIIISAPVTTSEQIIESLEKIGVGKLYGMIYVHSLEYVTEKAEISTMHRASREEIEADIMEMSTLTVNFIVYSILASLLAGISLLTDNILILIASMIIAPAIGPILGLSLGIVIDNSILVKKALKSEIISLLLSVLIGIILGLIAPHAILTTSIIVRSEPTIIDISFAIIAGAAAALSIISVVSVALVGVAIAASIVPPAVNIGIGIAYALRGVPEGFTIAYGSTLLLMINIISIYLMSILFFWFTGIRPKLSERKHRIIRREVKKKIVALIIIFVLVATPVLYGSIITYNKIKIEEKIKHDVVDFIGQNYPEIRIIDIKVTYFTQNDTVQIIMFIGAKNYPENIENEIAGLVYSKYQKQCQVYIFYAKLGSRIKR